MLSNIMVYALSRTGSTTLVKSLANNRLCIENEFMQDVEHKIVANQQQHVRNYPLTARRAVEAISKDNAIISRIEITDIKDELFNLEFIDTSIFLHRRDIIETEISSKLAEHVNIWNSNEPITLNDKITLNVKQFEWHVNYRLGTLFKCLPKIKQMEVILTYEYDLQDVITATGYNSLDESYVKIFNNKENMIENYNELIAVTKPLNNKIEDINESIAAINTGLTANNIDFDKY